MALNYLSSLFGAKPARQDWRDLEGTKVSAKIFEAILVDNLRAQVFTAGNYGQEAPEDAVALRRWQNEQVELTCEFARDDDEVLVTMPVQHWDVLIGHSVYLDHEIFVNDANQRYNKYGWYVHAHSNPHSHLKVIFKQFVGHPKKYVPDHIYYVTAVWNKAAILREGLLAGSRFDEDDAMYYSEYDIFLESCNINYIRSIAESMHELHESVLAPGARPQLPIIVLRIDVRMLPSEPLPYFEEHQGVLRSYTYVPPAAIGAIMHEDAQSPD